MLTLSGVEQELRDRLEFIGSFSDEDSKRKLRQAILYGLNTIWYDREWDFRNSKVTISTVAGLKGPYPAPSGMVNFAGVQKVTQFGWFDKYRLAPVIVGGEPDTLRSPYLNVQDGFLYFVDDPGSSTITLNYKGQLLHDTGESAMTANVALFPDMFFIPLSEFAMADILRRIPGQEGLVRFHVDEGYRVLKRLWGEVISGRGNQIVPRGLNGVPVEGIALGVDILGIPRMAGDGYVSSN